MNNKQKLYTVFVGGVEVTDTLLTYDEALVIKAVYLVEGYDDVSIDEYR